MNQRALLGLFTITSLIAFFGIYVVLSDFVTRTNGYRMGVRFASAAGLTSGSLVYESGVVVGSVDQIKLLPDYSSDVIIALRSSVNVPSNASFLIVQPLQGDPTLRIILRSPVGNGKFVPAPPFAHEVLPPNQQPVGQATLSLAEFLAQGQDQVGRIDDLLAQFQHRAPQLLDAMQQTLENSTKLTKDADRSLLQLSGAANSSLSTLNSSSRLLTTQLSQSLAIASANMIDITARLDESTKTGQPHIEHMLVNLDDASQQLSASMDSLHQIAADPTLRDNVIATTHSIAETSATFAALLKDLRKVTGNEQTQTQMRDVIANVDAASQKANSLLGSLGGRSNVTGVDTTATATATATSPSELPIQHPSPRPRPISLHQSLFDVQVRLGELSPEHSDPHGNAYQSRLLGQDRGPQTDITLVGLPNGPTNILIGANDIGYNSTLTLAAVHHQGAASYGGGILYSTLGVTAGVDGKRFGVSTNVYDPRRGTVDVYGKIFADANHNTAIYAGERDATRDARRDVFGLQFSF